MICAIVGAGAGVFGFVCGLAFMRWLWNGRFRWLEAWETDLRNDERLVRSDKERLVSDREQLDFERSQRR